MWIGKPRSGGWAGRGALAESHRLQLLQRRASGLEAQPLLGLKLKIGTFAVIAGNAIGTEQNQLQVLRQLQQGTGLVLIQLRPGG